MYTTNSIFGGFQFKKQNDINQIRIYGMCVVWCILYDGECLSHYLIDKIK